MNTCLPPPATQSASKIRFVVIDENKLGYILPQIPLAAQILASSVIRGASCCRLGGSYPLGLDPEWVRSADCPKPLDLAKVRAGVQPVKFDPAHVRPATRLDFDTFRVSILPYEKDGDRYECPAA